MTLEMQIKRSQFDKGKYYLLDESIHENIIKILYKRIGVLETGFTCIEYDCEKNIARDIGYGEESISNIKENISNWYELVECSSKYDVVTFILNQKKQTLFKKIKNWIAK